MYKPDKKSFRALSRKGNLIPIYKEISSGQETPVSLFEKIQDKPYAFLLESVEGEAALARYSFLGCSPQVVLGSQGGQGFIRQNGKKRLLKIQDPLSGIKKYLKSWQFVQVKGLPRFCGGFMGYMGYDCIRFWEQIPRENPDHLKLPDALFILTDTLIIFDHLKKKVLIVCNVNLKGGHKTQGQVDRIYDKACRKIDKVIERLNPSTSSKRQARVKPKRHGRGGVIRSNLSRQAFERIVKRAKAYIRAGDVVQVVLSQRFEKRVSAEPFRVYQALRKINPSPYMFYLTFGSARLIGASPELLVRCEDTDVWTRPIAGTRRRGRSQKEDQALSRDLISDPKERAEHVMLVDLGRNDIGRVCRNGSVKVKHFMRVERYSHVMHLVSDVSGRLRKGKGRLDLLRAAFPAGTVTGAPKVRAMQIIEELETSRRGPYAGLVGYFSFSGNFDTCIMIRTIVMKKDVAYIQAGAGIVADSVPSKEYQETVNKAKALFKAIEHAERGKQ